MDENIKIPKGELKEILRLANNIAKDTDKCEIKFIGRDAADIIRIVKLYL